MAINVCIVTRRRSSSYETPSRRRERTPVTEAARMHLTLFINPTGHHQASWRHPRATPDAGVNFAHYVELAQAAERACFDAVFFADNQVVRQGSPEVVGRVAQYVANFEPLTLMSALAARTERIGFICTASTSYNLPFQVARKFASIDHISGGRAGWNVVTSGMPGENFNFGHDAHYPHDELYERAAEFVDICRGLWDSWDDDAFPRDPESGVAWEHVLDHDGRFFRVRGPLNVARPPQGHPMLVQAGQSPEGTQFAARYADMVFVTPQSLQEGQERYRTIKELAEAAGRDPDHVKVMPGLAVITGPTDADAEADFELLQSLLHPDVALKMLATKINMSTGRKGEPDLSGYALDEPLPLSAGPDAGGVSFGPWAQRGQREGLTLIELARVASESLVGLSIRGCGEHIADVMEEWVRAGAADGFNIQPAFLPGGLDDFIAYVVPHLQARGLLRQAYEGRTLRDHFGLPRMPMMARTLAS
jgi:FMN-dependent oxidoreductase (nitrilotriacetate monooxygenase family)